VILSREDRLRALSLERCCQVLGVSRSYVLRAQEPVSAEREWRSRLEELCLEFPGYGYRRVSVQLQKEGFAGSGPKAVRRLMKELGLERRRRARRARTTFSGGSPCGANLARALVPESAGRLLVSDLTYLALPKGFCYLAVVMDAFSRRALGWSLSLSLETALALGALRMALESASPSAGWIHHSDRGVQYASREYRALVEEAGGLSSFSRKGNPYDNAAMESFFKTLKTEEAGLLSCESFDEATRSVAGFIDLYNSRRLHSSLGYKSPLEYERLHAEQKTA
jgi:putative transposase